MHLTWKCRSTVGGTCLAALLLAGLTAVLAPSASAAVDNTRAAAWAVGHNLSLAALLYGQEADPKLIEQTLGAAKAAASAAGVEVKPLPPRAETKGKTMAAVIHYLVKGDGWSTGEALFKKYGRGPATLFEIAVKSNLGILLYQPGDDSGIAGVVKSRAEAINLPAELWQPVVTAMTEKRPADEVKQAIFKMHDAVAAALVKDAGAAPAGQGGSPSNVGELLERGGKRLSGGEIKKLFAGATISGTAMGTRDNTFSLHYTADGKASGEGKAPGTTTRISGTWSANDKDQYCQKLVTGNGAKIEGCYDYFMLGERLFLAPSDNKSAPVYERQLAH